MGHPYREKIEQDDFIELDIGKVQLTFIFNNLLDRNNTIYVYGTYDFKFDYGTFKIIPEITKVNLNYYLADIREIGFVIFNSESDLNKKIAINYKHIDEIIIKEQQFKIKIPLETDEKYQKAYLKQRSYLGAE